MAAERAQAEPQAPAPWPALLEQQIRALLVCPQCYRHLNVEGERLSCAACAFEGAIRDDVVIMGKAPANSFFDDKYLVMHAGHSGEGGDWEFAYGQQVAFLEPYLRAGSVILDVGCGPSIGYRKPAGSFLVGLEYSYPSIRVNREVDLRICGSAAELPFDASAVDLIICFYSLHHMVGANRRETRTILERVLGELSRVLKPGGHLVVFEMRPTWPFAIAQTLCWDTARRILGGKLDMYMWSQAALEPPGSGRIPGARFEAHGFKTSALKLLSPVFALPWLKIPRMLYPLSPVAYVWTKP
jgi:SAM-dependent methyltransferase